MRSRVVAAAVAGLALAISWAMPAAAQIRLDRPIGGGGQPQAQSPQQAASTLDGVNPDQMLRVLSGVGFTKGEVLKLDNNLRAIKAEVGGTPVFTIFFNCEGDKCASFAFATFFGKQNVNATFINAFNRDRRFAKLQTDKDGNLSLTMDVWLYGGVTPAYLATSGVIFATAIKWLVEFKA